MHWAHQVADQFPDGQLYVNLRGFGPSGSPVDPVAHGFLIALAVGPERIPADRDAQSALYRSVVAGKRLLLVLDNARDVEQIRPLLPGSGSCVAVVTSRRDLVGLVASPGAVPITVGQLGADEAMALLSRLIGPERLAPEPVAVGQLIELSAYLPLALTIIGARAASMPETPLCVLVAELDRRLDALDTRRCHHQCAYGLLLVLSEPHRPGRENAAPARGASRP